MKDVECPLRRIEASKIYNLQEKGFAPVKLLMIVVLGIIVGAGAYVSYKSSAKPAAEKTGSEQPTKPESTAKPQTPSAKGNFSKKGAVVAQEDGWVLVWDEPGQMAANVKLKFTDQSTCILGGEKKDCGLINQGPQSYDYASVEGNRNNGEVTVIKLEELKSPQ